MTIEIGNLLLIIATAWVVGLGFRMMKLPLLLGELTAGLILGPAMLGLFHDTVAVRVMAELGIFFLMLHAGLETEPKALMKSSKLGLAIAFAGMLLPFGLGVGVSLLFGTTLIQALFVGMGLSITAISVTVKIFKDFRYQNQEIVNLVMVAALADDILAFILVSVILTVGTAGAMSLGGLAILVLKVVGFFAAVLFLGNVALKHVFLRFFSTGGQKSFTLTIIIGLTFGTIAELLGIHFVIGAYIAGLFVDESLIHPSLYKKIEDRLFGITYGFLGPVFFVSLAFHVEFDAFTNPHTLAFLAAILVAAVVGKVAGAGAIAWRAGRSLRESGIIGFAMNGRGAVELILAAIGLETGIITVEIFSVLVVMAFVTTFVTPLALKPLIRQQGSGGSGDGLSAAAAGRD